MMSDENLKNINRLLMIVTDKPNVFERNILDYIFKNELQTILNATNQDKLPKELEHIVEERTVGRLLLLHKDMILNSDDFNAPQSVKEGDISVTFNGSSKESRFNELANTLLRDREDDIICFRTLKW